MDIAEVYREKIRKARKDYICEIGFPIKKGDEYCYVSGIFDHTPFSFRLNLFAKKMLDKKNEGIKYDDQSNYNDFWDIEWSLQEYNEMWIYLAKIGHYGFRRNYISHKREILTLQKQYGEKIQKLQEEVDKQKLINLSLCEEWACTDEYVTVICRNLEVDENTLAGDSYGVPTIIDKFDMMTEKLFSEREEFFVRMRKLEMR